MRKFAFFMVMVSLLLSAAIFGFFYAWLCSTMWGLDKIDPRVAINAMQAMNSSVRNAVFAPAFFGTPIALCCTAIVLFYMRHKKSALMVAIASIIYICFCFILTAVINVPMNVALAAVIIPEDIQKADLIWKNFSQPWQFWNLIRFIASGIVFTLTVLAVFSLPRTQLQECSKKS
ncbi:anthrone oxygenase family protein [Bartonella sp. HY761]|uniref:anthrone oxygenase family protein n=1 Tax=Bartonella sp. HY761 TaxID=2979330 RepID=UPI002202ED98|nr:anthrone oxygenase family protein [Bartonella sp. HY761]UXN06970.1 DUF1772 domain-containing protein [Bartonella sp. HY761]